VRAVDGVSYAIEPGETLGIVGESGSGKSVSCYALLGLIPSPPGRIESGSARFGDIDLLHASEAQLRSVRGKRISMIFQDPMTALNPFMTVGEQLVEPLRVHEGMPKRAARERAAEMLDAVGIQDATARLDRYPHQFSGGMRQRVMIAMALITRPDLLIADEPTTALDVTVQAQILELIQSMQKELGMAVLLITHDLGVVAGTCDRVLVMYAGKICERAPAEDLFAKPRHPYTEALIASLPSVTTHGRALYTIPGSPPDLRTVFAECPFAPRCEHVAEVCREGEPPLASIGGGRETACVRVAKGAL
jgi:oligopeptide transport system ATP-binding protein